VNVEKSDQEKENQIDTILILVHQNDHQDLDLNRVLDHLVNHLVLLVDHLNHLVNHLNHLVNHLDHLVNLLVHQKSLLVNHLVLLVDLLDHLKNHEILGLHQQRKDLLLQENQDHLLLQEIITNLQFVEVNHLLQQ